ncbi:MAG TPA: hypothetical protein VIP05_07765 [Burkholderiaceae bacterium]
MTPSLEQWKVLPHGQLTEVDENILTVTGDLRMPLAHIPRRMTVVRLADGRLVIFSAISLAEAQMRELEAYGRPSFLIVPNDHHRLDAKAWKERYPALQVVAPQGARGKVQAVVPVDTTNPRWDDPNVQFIAVPGTLERESALLVQSRHGTTLVLNDVIGNMPDESGFGGWFLRKMGFAGDQPHIPGPVRLLMVDDKAALRRQLLQWADIESLHCILVSHGLPIDERPQQTLRELASTLA